MMTRVVEIISGGEQGPMFPVESIPWLLMTWRHKEPDNRQPVYWPEIFRFHSLKVLMNLHATEAHDNCDEGFLSTIHFRNNAFLK